VSSTFFGVCNGKVWFEGTEPQEPQEIRLNIQHIETNGTLPSCNLILSETEQDSVNLKINVSTMALFYQNGNFETWLSIDKQKSEKLVGVFDSWGSAAGEFYERKYNVTLSGLEDGAHLIKIRVAGEYYGPNSGNYDCEGSVSFMVDQYPAETPTKTESPTTTETATTTEPPTTESFPTTTRTAVAVILIGVAIITVLIIVRNKKKSI
jgi:hypothetical protein